MIDILFRRILHKTNGHNKCSFERINVFHRLIGNFINPGEKYDR